MTYLNTFSNYENPGDGISLDQLAEVPDHWYSGAGGGSLRALYGVGAIGAKVVGLAAHSVIEFDKLAVPERYEHYIDEAQDMLFEKVVKAPADQRLEFMSHNKTTASQIAYGLTEGLGSMVYGAAAGGAIIQGVNRAEETIAEGGSVGKAYAKGVITGGAFYLGAKVASSLPVVAGSGVLSTVAQKALTGGAINTAIGVSQRAAEQGVEEFTDGHFDPDKVFNSTESAVDFGLGAAFGILGKTNKPDFKDLPIQQKDAMLQVVEDKWFDGKIPEAVTAKEAKDIQIDLIETEKAFDENRDPVYLAEKVSDLPRDLPRDLPAKETIPEVAKEKTAAEAVEEQVLGEYDGVNLDAMAKQFDDKLEFIDEDGSVKTFAQLKELAVKDIEQSKTVVDKLKKLTECILEAK